MRNFRLGLVVNPYSGIGGAVALKGSDGAEIRAEALRRGAQLRSGLRAQTALQELLPCANKIEWFTCAGAMGADLLAALGMPCSVVYRPSAAQTEAHDTQAAVAALTNKELDLLIFAGGDGTARDIAAALGNSALPVVGIPAGVKIHSGVYAITPKAAGQVVAQLIQGELTTLRQADVMDIDEQAFRVGTVRAKRYGELSVPGALEHMQAVKVGGKESDALVLGDIAADIVEGMDEQALYVMGSGSTVEAIMFELGLPNTLLGVDLVAGGRLIAADVTAAQIEQAMAGYNKTYLVITLIGGQGHIFGRGNQQLSPSVIQHIPRENILVVATKKKLQALEGRPLIADTGDTALDEQLSGFMTVTTGYHDKTMVAVRSAN